MRAAPSTSVPEQASHLLLEAKLGMLSSPLRWSVLILLLTLPLAPASVRAHKEGSTHGHGKQSQGASQPGGSQVGMVRWTDDRGRVHYSQGMDSVPLKYRSKAVPLGRVAPSSQTK